MTYEFHSYNIDTETWYKTFFSSKREYTKYVESQLKYPGEYSLKYTEGLWNKQSKLFQEFGEYPKYVQNSTDFRRHWDTEKEKCQHDSIVIFKSEKENIEFALPSLYYWYLNYTPIYDKIKKKLDFAEIWDSDYHFYLTILLCILRGEHLSLLKKRQWGSSLKHTSILSNYIWFGNNTKAKIFSYAGIHTENSWVFLEGYRDHLNKFAGWKRGFDPNKFMDWQIRRKRNDGTYVGNMSILKGLSTEKDASKPVGGGATAVFCEEAGMNPNLNKTHEYLLPAVGLGALTTGLLMYAGSVGELDKCEPLKEYILKPIENGFIGCENRCDGDEELGPLTGFFAPEWWNYFYGEDGEVKRCYDKWGNSNKEQALEIILKLREVAKSRNPEAYRYYVSQHPLCIKEAFDYRKDSIFPQALLTKQDYRIDRGDYPYTMHDIEMGSEGKPVLKKATYSEITKFPYSPKKDEIPYGCIKIWEMPKENPQFGTYFAAVDPIDRDKTTTSDSLFSVIIYKNISEIIYVDDADGTEKVRLEGDRIVASYVGRKEDRLKTNETGELLIELYNAFAVIENNVDNFVRHMITKGKQKYMATKADLPFLKELGLNTGSHQEYGVSTNTSMWSQYINKILEYLKEETGVRQMDDGKEMGKIFGVEKIPDKRLVKELLAFTDEKGNYDQVVTLGLVLCLAKSRQMNGLVVKIDERKSTSTNKNLYKIDRNPFKNIGQNNINTTNRPRIPYRNIR